MTSKNLFKKLSVLALVFVMIFAFAACENTGTGSDDTTEADTYSVTFYVIDGSENPVEGAEVSLSGAESTSGTTGTDGKVTFAELEGEYDYTVTYGGVVFKTGTVTSADDGTEILVNTSEDPGEVTFQSASVNKVNPWVVAVRFNSPMDIISFYEGSAPSVRDVDTVAGFTVEVNGVEVDIDAPFPLPSNILEMYEEDLEFQELLYEYINAPTEEEYEAWMNLVNYLQEKYGGQTNLVGFWIDDDQVKEGDTVTISYDADVTGATASDIFGNELGSFGPEDVSNDVVQPRIVSAVIEDDDPDQVIVEFDTDMYWDDFYMAGSAANGGSKPLTFNYSEVEKVYPSSTSDPRVYNYYLTVPVKEGEEVTISYPNESGETRDKYGNELVDYEAFAVTNNSVGPELVGAYIGEEGTSATTSSTITVEASETLSDLTAADLAMDGFTVRQDGTLLDISSIGLSGKYVNITTNETFDFETTGVTVTYDEETGTLEDSNSSNPLPGFENVVVANNLAEPLELALDSAVATSQTAITLTFNKTIDLDATALKDALVMMYNGTEVTNYTVTISSDTATLALNGELDADYMTGDATVAFDGAAAVDVVDEIAPTLLSVTAVDNSTMEFAFSEEVIDVDFKNMVSSTDLELTNSVVTFAGNTVTVALDTGFELPDGQFADVTIDPGAVKDNADNTNPGVTLAVTDAIRPSFTGIEATYVSATQTDIELSFSEDVSSASGITAADFEVVAGGFTMNDITLTWTDGVSTQAITVNGEVTTDSTISVEIVNPEKVVDSQGNLLVDPFIREDTTITE